MILKIEASGRDLRKRINEFLACYMRSPDIEPDRSSRKMYSPRYWSKLDLADFGGKKETLTHSWPIVQMGFEKSACSKEN